MRRLARLCMAAALVLCAAGSAQAHDTWVMPAAFRLSAGQTVLTTLSAGHGLTPLSAPRRRRLRTLRLVDASGSFEPLSWQRGPVSAQAGFAAPAPGVACLALSTRETRIEIDNDTVDDYLAEVQPPQQIVDAWQAQRARGEAWVELYAKDAKTYLRAGRTSTGWPQLACLAGLPGMDRRLGQRLEMVPLQDPTRLEVGASMALRLLFDGQPLAGAALRLFAGQTAERMVRTDADGQASFALTATGAHLIATTVLALPAGAGAPWTSRFATLGFGVGRA